METLKEFTEIVTGNISLAQLLAYILFGIAGAIVSLWMEVGERNKNSYRTPVPFSLKFMLSDNKKRIVATVLFLFLFVRFFNELTGMELNAFSSLVAGANIDRIMQFGKKGIGILRKKGEVYE